MALTTATDISVVLSGGSINLDSNNSLGGNPSNSPIVDGVLNNLFEDVSPSDTEAGREDYRCIYYFNDGPSSIYSIKVFIEENYEGGASCQIGIQQRNEIQRIQVTGSISSGSLTLSYEGVSFVVPYNSDLATWANSFATLLNGLVDGSGNKLLTNTSVTAQTTDVNTVLFDISFLSLDGNRNHSKLVLVSNNLNAQITILKLQEGFPINTIAPEIGLATTPPGGVVFSVSEIDIPYLKSEDGFPLWIKRTIPAGSDALAEDGLKIRFVGEAIAP